MTHLPRVLLLALGGVAVLLTGCGSDSGEAAADGLTKVTYVTGTPPGGKFANIVAAQKRGYFRDEGIEVEISLVASSDANKLIGSGKAEFGSPGSLDQILARSQGVPIVSLATTTQGSTHGIMAPAGSGVTEPRDLEGLTVGMTGLPGNQAILEDILRRHGADPGEIRFIEVGFNGAEGLAKGTIDALGDAASWNVPMQYSAIQGKPPDDTSTFAYLPYTELGSLRYYGFGLATSERYLADNPDTVRGFVRAWLKGLEWSMAHPDEAARLTVEAYPELKLDTALAQWKDLAEKATSPETEQHGLGWQDPEVFREEAEFLYEKGIIDKPVDIDAIVSNEYLPAAD